MDYKFTTSLSNCRRYAKRRFKDLLMFYSKHGWLPENSGQQVISDCERYLDSQGITSAISTRKYEDCFVSDLEKVVDVLQDMVEQQSLEALYKAQGYVCQHHFFDQFNSDIYVYGY